MFGVNCWNINRVVSFIYERKQRLINIYSLIEMYSTPQIPEPIGKL